MGSRRTMVGCLLAVLLSATCASLAAGPTTRAASGPLVVLDGASVWRTFHVMKPPVLQLDDGPKPVLLPPDYDWANRATPAAPPDWRKPGFDDSSWLRGSAGAHARTPYLARLCLRTHFEVTDPAQVKGLKLTLSYYGGAIVSVNGQELARGHVAKSGEAELAEAYPAEAFVSADGKILPDRGAAGRERTLADVAVPAEVLRKGVNTLAIEIVRSPYHKVIEEKKAAVNAQDAAKGGCPYTLSWNTCQLGQVKLAAAGGDGLTANTGRPPGWQAWNGDLLTQDSDSDLGDRCEPLRPIAIRGARNGWYSGKLVVGSAKPIEGLKAVVTDLKQGAATIPASAIRVRYGSAWAGGSGALEALLESPPEVFPGGRNGTVVPIWVTLKTPADAKPGTYTGQLTVTAKGEQAITAPVQLELADWVLPDQDNWRAWIELIQSPDTLALEYDTPLWSEKHWKLIEQSMRYMGEAGSRTVYIPLISHTNFGNSESMVRWIRKADGTYDWDFSIMDKYLDLAQKQGNGKLKLAAFNVWEVYLFKGGGAVTVTEADKKDMYTYIHKEAEAKRWEMRNLGPAVTALDPATGKTDTIHLPRFEDPNSKAIWKPLFDELHKRMAKRGLEDVMALAMVSDIWPTKEENAAIEEASGKLPWVNHTHGGGYRFSLAPVKYTAYVWNNVYGPDPSKERYYGWQRPDLVAQYLRFDYLNRWPLASLLRFEEYNITGQQRGLGRIGADFWATIKDNKGRRIGRVADRYPESFWHSLNIGHHMLMPGPTGPVASSRYEVLREGAQECEARIAIEQVLTDKTLKAKLPPELAQRSQDVLDERVRETWRVGGPLVLPGKYNSPAGLPLFDQTYDGGTTGHVWFAGSGWLDRAAKLYDLAGEVERKLQER